MKLPSLMRQTPNLIIQACRKIFLYMQVLNRKLLIETNKSHSSSRGDFSLGSKWQQVPGHCVISNGCEKSRSSSRGDFSLRSKWQQVPGHCVISNGCEKSPCIEDVRFLPAVEMAKSQAERIITQNQPLANSSKLHANSDNFVVEDGEWNLIIL